MYQNGHGGEKTGILKTPGPQKIQIMKKTDQKGILKSDTKQRKR